MNRMSQSPSDLKLGSITRAQRKKLKLQEDNDMNAYMEDALKRKIKQFDGQEIPPKLFTMCSIVKEILFSMLLEVDNLLPTEVELGHPPTFVDMFNKCYTNSNGNPSSTEVGFAMVKDIIALNDILSQVLGLDKYERVCMLGGVVHAADVWGEHLSRSTTNRIMEEQQADIKNMQK
ncbi:hypothetical protein M9H77_17206 [Catharanthus roseus]|uniref:Uncharacterized protein n=1 Tax=Catharanthus roseus TaxID=4058 RepID=A0ACC0B3Y1_CATRO|nr:hypothetical protein M9H77_17206 [Catharanthus roseus]